MSAAEEEKKAAESKEEELQDMKKIVVDMITRKCKEATAEDFDDIKAIGSALNKGDQLVVEVVSGGQTNYSFKVSLKDSSSKKLFCKLSFSYALWNPDRNNKYDVQRAENEYDIMNRFTKIMDGAPVPQVYYCLDVPTASSQYQAKLLIAEWSLADQQFARQFADGNVDMRVLVKVAEAFATLNLQPCDYEWNETCRDCMRSLHPLYKQIFSDLTNLPQDKADACAVLCKELGEENLHKIIHNLDQEYMECRQVLCHNDTKPHNILVEKQQSTADFGDRGIFALVDWEMSIKGRSGKDAGIFQAWTIACALCHAVQGHKQEAYHLLDSVVKFWNTYETTLRQEGSKDDAYLLDAFKGSLGGTFLYLHIAYYMLGLDAEDLPLEGAPEQTAGKAKGAMGKTGLQIGEIAYLDKDADLNLQELKEMVFKTLIQGEIESLLKVSEVLPRRASHSMVSGRRASDALLMEKATRRLTHPEEMGGRASIYGISVPEELLDLDEDGE